MIRVTPIFPAKFDTAEAFMYMCPTTYLSLPVSHSLLEQHHSIVRVLFLILDDVKEIVWSSLYR